MEKTSNSPQKDQLVLMLTWQALVGEKGKPPRKGKNDGVTKEVNQRERRLSQEKCIQGGEVQRAEEGKEGEKKIKEGKRIRGVTQADLAKDHQHKRRGNPEFLRGRILSIKE